MLYLAGLLRSARSILLTTPTTALPHTLSPTPSPPFTAAFSRAYRSHMAPRSNTEPHGRSVPVSGKGVAMAYFRLREILNESEVRQTVRYQERFERNHDRMRRKRREADWRVYMAHVKKQVGLAKELDLRKRIARKNYDEI
ncbi:hypothetical protein DFJ73DRAFT_772056 [Zopfochytrium polystomum]|nr:hypothetical protein DFJ73DRAFT_772056 [Zopfochytrium polystomum]